MMYTTKNLKLRNTTNVKLAINRKDYSKWTSKQTYMSQKLFNNNLVTIRKKKTKLHYLGICIEKLNKVLMYKFYKNYIKINMEATQDFYLHKLIVQCMKLKLKMNILEIVKKHFILVSIPLKIL